MQWENCSKSLEQCNATEIGIIKDFGPIFKKTLMKLGNSSSRGVFLDSCYLHLQFYSTYNWISAPVLHNKPLLQPQFLGFLLKEDHIALSLDPIHRIFGKSKSHIVPSLAPSPAHKEKPESPAPAPEAFDGAADSYSDWMDPSTAAELNRNEDFLSRSPSLAPETEGAENLVASPVSSPETHGIKLVLLILTNWDNKGLGTGASMAATTMATVVGAVVLLYYVVSRWISAAAEGEDSAGGDCSKSKSRSLKKRLLRVRR
ncbi:hypothetical protein SASPL_134817 [Salvia splendens]|uniref:Pectin acetylesterase n=1 Tax=Salvia splendens TaxID=180675 RepID=A0A8X8WVC9_SALSN|nr:hypothetical protein SASPL_134817 [Salvia splendens]